MAALKTPSLVGEMGLPGRRGYSIALLFGFQTKEGLGLCLINSTFMSPSLMS